MANPEWYNKYVDWYNQNMAQHVDNPSAQKQFHRYALAYYDQIQNNQKASEQEKEQDKARLAAVAASVGGPAAYWLANRGEDAAKDVAKDVVKDVAKDTITNTGGATGTLVSNSGGQGLTSLAHAKEAGAAHDAAYGASQAGNAGAAEVANPGVLGNIGSMGSSLGGLGALAGIGGGIALGAKGAKDLLDGKTTKGPEGWGGRATLGIATGGLSELARPFFRKTTDDYRKERIAELGDSSRGWQDYQQQRYDAEKAGTSSHDGWEAGEKWNFDKANQLAQGDGTHFIGVMGNAQTFGDDFLRLDQDKQKQIAQRLANDGLYHSDKGNVLIAKDKQDQARSVYDQIIGGAQ